MSLSSQPSMRGGSPGVVAPRAWSRRRWWGAVVAAIAMTTGGSGARTQESAAPSRTEPASPQAPATVRRWSPAAHDRVPFRPGRFEREIRAYENADRASPPPAGAVLFVGSSSIRFWNSLQDDFEGVPVLNRGFGGSHLEDLIHYARRIILPYHARRIIIYAGDNDLNAGKSPDTVFQDFRTLVQLIRRRQPRAVIGFVSIKPSPARWSKIPRVRETNRRIRDYCDEHPNLEFIDVFSRMIDENGRPRRDLYQPDGLHLTPAGYALWAEELAPFVRGTHGSVAQGASQRD